MAERKIFVCIDGSEQSSAAFHWYLDNLYKTGDHVFLVHSPEFHADVFLPGPATDFQQVTQDMKRNNDQMEVMFNKYMDILRSKQIKASSHVVPSTKPGQAVISQAEKDCPHSIIVGSRGLGKLRRTFLGSVSEYILHHAPPGCAVTVYRSS